MVAHGLVFSGQMGITFVNHTGYNHMKVLLKNNSLLQNRPGLTPADTEERQHAGLIHLSIE